MTTSKLTQKQTWMEAFNSVTALYYILKANSTSLRVKQALYRQDEVEAQPIDFIIDVEIKTKRFLGEPVYQMFLLAVASEQTDQLSETMRELLGSYWIEYGLGPEGAYRKLYYTIKNEQMRSFLKGNNVTGDIAGTEYVGA